jgi:hypothetical protein
MVAHYAAVIRVASEDRGGSFTELDPFLQLNISTLGLFLPPTVVDPD